MKLPQVSLRDLISERFTRLRRAKIPIPVTSYQAQGISDEHYKS